VDFGDSYLPSDMNAAYLWAQLEMADAINENRLATWNAYDEAFRPLAEKGLLTLPTIPEDCVHNAHMYYVKCKDLEERTSFIPVTVWGKLATICERYLGKGSAVLVEGRLKSEEYERQGVKIRTMRVIADQIHFLNKKNDAGNVNTAAPAAPSFNPPPMGGNGWQVDDSDLPM
jgi:hypothetical protein